MREVETRVKQMLAQRGQSPAGTAVPKSGGCGGGCGSKPASTGGWVPAPTSSGNARTPRAAGGTFLPCEPGPIGRHTTLRKEGHA